MKVLVKKFTLVRDGVTYNAGEIVDLPVEEATRLVNESGKEFALLADCLLYTSDAADEL